MQRPAGMLSDGIRAQARALRGRGLTCRETAAALGGRISKSSVCRLAPGTRIRGVRCKTCGAMVIPPCKLCSQSAPESATAPVRLPLLPPAGPDGDLVKRAAGMRPGRKDVA